MRAWLLLAALLAPACDRSEAPAPSANVASGPVLLVDGRIEIHESDVDPYLPAVALIEPRFVQKQLVRLALTNVVLPRAVARALAGEEAYARARTAAETARAQIDSGEWTGPVAPDSSGGTRISGPYSRIGLERWTHAFDLQPGEWSPVFEEIGAFSFVKCLSRVDGKLPIQTEFDLEVVSFFYLPEDKGEALVEAGYDRIRLKILVPEWREIVPELLQYRMGAHSP